MKKLFLSLIVGGAMISASTCGFTSSAVTNQETEVLNNVMSLSEVEMLSMSRPTLSDPQSSASYYEEYPLVSYLTTYSLVRCRTYGFDNPSKENKTLIVERTNSTSNPIEFEFTSSHTYGTTNTLETGVRGDLLTTVAGFELTQSQTITTSHRTTISSMKTLRVYSYDGCVRDVTYNVVKRKRTRSWPWVAFDDYEVLEPAYYDEHVKIYYGDFLEFVES